MVAYTKRIATKQIFHCSIVIDKEKFKNVGLWCLTPFLSVKISIPKQYTTWYGRSFRHQSIEKLTWLAWYGFHYQGKRHRSSAKNLTWSFEEINYLYVWVSVQQLLDLVVYRIVFLSPTLSIWISSPVFILSSWLALWTGSSHIIIIFLHRTTKYTMQGKLSLM